jgi:hypothetical protein
MSISDIMTKMFSTSEKYSIPTSLVSSTTNIGRSYYSLNLGIKYGKLLVGFLVGIIKHFLDILFITIIKVFKPKYKL